VVIHEPYHFQLSDNVPVLPPLVEDHQKASAEAARSSRNYVIALFQRLSRHGVLVEDSHVPLWISYCEES